MRTEGVGHADGPNGGVYVAPLPPLAKQQSNREPALLRGRGAKCAIGTQIYGTQINGR